MGEVKEDEKEKPKVERRDVKKGVIVDKDKIRLIRYDTM